MEKNETESKLCIELEQIPEKIESIEKEILQIQKRIETERETYEILKSKIISEITSEKDLVTNKNIFSNVESRSAELTKRVNEEPRTKLLLESINNNTTQKQELQITLGCLERKFGATRTILEFLASFKK